MSDDARAAWARMRELVLDHDHRAMVAATFGMSYVRVKAVREIAAGELAHHELASRLAIDKPYTTVIIRDLLGRGLVQTRPHPEDGRSKLISITAAGADLAERAGLLMTEPPPALIALEARDRAELNRILGLLSPG